MRVIREEFNADYRGVVIDDQRLHSELQAYIGAFNPELADRVEYYDHEAEGLSLFEQYHVHEQVHKALDRKVWLPSGGSLIIEHTEALTVIDVNTGKNVGTSSLEETVFHNNMEAADEIAKQLRLRDIGGIIVIDFIDMENRSNRAAVVERFRNALSRDKTRSQVFDISDLGLVEMTRKRIGEGLLTEFSEICPECEGRGVIVDHAVAGLDSRRSGDAVLPRRHAAKSSDVGGAARDGPRAVGTTSSRRAGRSRPRSRGAAAIGDGPVQRAAGQAIRSTAGTVDRVGVGRRGVGASRSPARRVPGRTVAAVEGHERQPDDDHQQAEPDDEDGDAEGDDGREQRRPQERRRP